MVLGGGGYTIRNVSRAWTYETGILTGQKLDENLPFNEYINYYGPEYSLFIPPSNMENYNGNDYLENPPTNSGKHS